MANAGVPYSPTQLRSIHFGNIPIREHRINWRGIILALKFSAMVISSFRFKKGDTIAEDIMRSSFMAEMESLEKQRQGEDCGERRQKESGERQQRESD